MAVGDLYRTSIGFSQQGQSNINVLYFRQNTASAPDNAQKAAERLAPLLEPIWNKVSALPYRGLSFEVTCQQVSRLFSDVGTKIVVWPGDGPNEVPLPPAVAAVIKMRTGFAGPRRRGRMFLGDVPVTFNTAGSVSTAAVAKYNIFMSELLTNFGGDNPVSGFSLGVFSRKNYSLLSNPFDDYFKPVTQLVLAGPLATMRSRKVGVGA